MNVGKKQRVGLRSGKSKRNLESPMGAIPLWLNQADQNILLTLDFQHCNSMFHWSVQPLGSGIPARNIFTNREVSPSPLDTSECIQEGGAICLWLAEYNVPGHS